MKETVTKTLQNEALLVRMSPDIKQRLFYWAKRWDKSAADVVRICIAEWLNDPPVVIKNGRKSK